MALVILVDQRGSSGAPDLVSAAATRLNERFADALDLAFVRTAGDEMQAVLGDPTPLPDLLVSLVDRGEWWVGLGVGGITHVGETARESAGPAFKAAREAVEATKRRRGTPGPSVIGEPPELAASLQAALAGWSFIRLKRTDRQREVVAAVEAAESQRAAAAALGVTHQAVSDALAAAGYDAELQLRELVARLAAAAVDA